MDFPRLLIDLDRLEENARHQLGLFKAQGVSLMGVNKVFSGLLNPALCLERAGYSVVAESRIRCLKNLAPLKIKKCLLRTPALNEMNECVLWSDISLHGSIESVRALARACVQLNKYHEVLFMIDMGDLREGLWFEDYPKIKADLEELISLSHISLYGLGANFNCFGAIKPTRKNNEQFVTIARRLEKDLQIKIPFLSGGNCTSYSLFEKGELPEGINHLRIGGLHLFGIDYINFKYVEGFHHSQMPINRVSSPLYKLQAQIIEIGRKPSAPVGESGLNAFLQPKTFVDRGIRNRAILNLGRLDVAYENFWPLDSGIEVLGQSSDHTIIDIEESTREYKLGDVLEFELDYTGLLFASQAPSIEKSYVGIHAN